MGHTEKTLEMGGGGPFLGLLRKTKLLRDGHGVGRPLLAISAVTWVPLVVLSPFSRGAASLLTDLSVHARLLVSIPLLLEADPLLHELIAVAVGRFAEERAVDGLEPQSVEAVHRHAERLRSSAAGELVCLLLALLVGQIQLWGKGAISISVQGAARPPVSPVTLWYWCVALPTFLFLLYRSLWRWLIWAFTLVRFSRMKLHLVPTHPDLSGGLTVLAIPARGFAMMLLAISVGVAGAWATQILFRGATLRSFGPAVAFLVAIALLLGLGPLLAFSGKLLRAKILGRVQYGSLARAYTTQFDERWIAHTEREGLLGTPDLQSLADLSTSFDRVRRMRVAPFDQYDALLLVLAVLLPISPLVLTEVPFPLLLSKLAHTLF
jgi:hypothetical protein